MKKAVTIILAIFLALAMLSGCSRLNHLLGVNPPTPTKRVRATHTPPSPATQASGSSSSAATLAPAVGGEPTATPTTQSYNPSLAGVVVAFLGVYSSLQG